MQIINNFNSIETLIFNFEQISQEKTERGKCYLKRPHFLKCLYNDEKGKELIINRKNLVVYHKKYNRKYYYPASKSYFLNILNKNKFKNLILDSRIFSKNNFEIVNLNNEKGNILFYFDKNKFDLLGWEISDINENKTIFKIENLTKNQKIENKLFFIPETN
tara:strand:+ start:2272 stop:2757 length:486 start_codon:yes stop_codon:yes gene_type:complete